MKILISYIMISITTFTIGTVCGGLLFDMFVSRPTLRILNEQLKGADRVIETLQSRIIQLNQLRRNKKE